VAWCGYSLPELIVNLGWYNASGESILYVPGTVQPTCQAYAWGDLKVTMQDGAVIGFSLPDRRLP
jgi:hypothetical protein